MYIGFTRCLTRFFIYFQFLYDEGPMLETLDYAIRIGSTPTFLYFDLYLHSACAARYVYIYRLYINFLYFDLYQKFMTELIHIKAYRDSARIK